jgi:hypothetical protein
MVMTIAQGLGIPFGRASEMGRGRRCWPDPACARLGIADAEGAEARCHAAAAIALGGPAIPGCYFLACSHACASSTATNNLIGRFPAARFMKRRMYAIDSTLSATMATGPRGS